MSETILLEYKYVISGTIKNLKFFSDLAIFRPKSSGPSGLKKWPGSISSQEAELPQWPGGLFDRTLMDLSKATNLIATGVPDEFSGACASPKIGVSYGSIIKFFIIAKMVYIDRIFRAEPENDVIFEK